MRIKIRRIGGRLPNAGIFLPPPTTTAIPSPRPPKEEYNTHMWAQRETEKKTGDEHRKLSDFPSLGSDGKKGLSFCRHFTNKPNTTIDCREQKNNKTKVDSERMDGQIKRAVENASSMAHSDD